MKPAPARSRNQLSANIRFTELLDERVLAPPKSVEDGVFGASAHLALRVDYEHASCEPHHGPANP